MTLHAARNVPLRVAELVPTSSRAKSNYSLARNQLNSDFQSFYSLAQSSGSLVASGGSVVRWSYISRHSESHSSHRARRVLPPLSETSMRVENPFLYPFDDLSSS